MKETKNSTSDSLASEMLNSLKITVDDLMEAYERGCKEGLDNHIKTMKKQLKTSLGNIMPVFTAYVDFLIGRNIRINSIFIKCINNDSFKFMIAIDSSTYYNDEICRPIYRQSFKVIETANDAIDISFMPTTSNFNKTGLILDKFIPIYESSK